MASRFIVFVAFACLAQGCFAQTVSESSAELKAEISQLEQKQATSAFLQSIGLFFARIEASEPSTTLDADRDRYAVGLAAGVQSYLTTLAAVLGTSASVTDEARSELAEVIRGFTENIFLAIAEGDKKDGNAEEIKAKIENYRDQADVVSATGTFYKYITTEESSEVAELHAKTVDSMTTTYSNMMNALLEKVDVAYGGAATGTDYKTPALAAVGTLFENIFKAIALVGA